jgi:hypothetical protein
MIFLLASAILSVVLLAGCQRPNNTIAAVNGCETDFYGNTYCNGVYTNGNQGTWGYNYPTYPTYGYGYGYGYNPYRPWGRNERRNDHDADDQHRRIGFRL